MVRKEAERIACDWSLVSKWTSFFLAEEPYTPIEQDPFVDGVVEVKEAPGDDLLEPRGSLQLTGSGTPIVLLGGLQQLSIAQSELSPGKRFFI